MTKKILTEFRAFAMKGNVVDLAVGVVVGGAFGKIVTSLVSDILMPLFGAALGAVDFKKLAWTIIPATENRLAVVMGYGAFLQTIIDFLIITGSIFLVIRLLSRMKRTEDVVPTPPAPPTPAPEILLLTEIRDLLKK